MVGILDVDASIGSSFFFFSVVLVAGLSVRRSRAEGGEFADDPDGAFVFDLGGMTIVGGERENGGDKGTMPGTENGV